MKCRRFRSIDRLAVGVGVIKSGKYAVSGELAMLVVDSNINKDLSGHTFIERVKTDAPALIELPFALLSVRFAACVGRVASPEPDFLFVSGQVLHLKRLKNNFKEYYKHKSPHTFRKQPNSAAALDYLNGLIAGLAHHIKLLVIDIDELGNNLTVLGQFRAILNPEVVIVVTVPVTMNVDFAILESLFSANVTMIVSAPIHDLFVPYLCALV